MSIIDIVNYSLLLVAAINIFMAGALYRIKNDKSYAFSAVLFFTALWSITMFYLRVANDESLIILFYRLTYITGYLLTLALFYFSSIYPYRIKRISSKELVVIFFLMAISLYALYSSHFVTAVESYDGWNSLVTSSVEHVLTSSILVYLFVRILSLLGIKARVATSLVRKNLMNIYFGVILAIVLGSMFAVVLPYFGNYYFNWLAPFSTVVMNYIVFRVIYKGSN